MNRLKEIREEKGLKQREIADIIHVGALCYSKYELGKSKLPADILIRLADYYNTNIDYLLYKTDIKDPLPKSNIN